MRRRRAVTQVSCLCSGAQQIAQTASPIVLMVFAVLETFIFIYFIIAVYVHYLGLYCILFRRFLISKINVALQLTKLLLKKVTTTTTTSVVYCSVANVHGANGQQLSVTGCVKKQVKMLALN